MQYKLIEEIVYLSEANGWDFAKLEWEFTSAYYSEQEQRCLCGHYPIRNICVIKNKKNFTITEVGNCCINKFLGIEDGNKIFTSIKRIKENARSSMSAEVLEYLYSKNAISDSEYKFYKSIHRRTRMSTKQWEFKERINRKFLNFTSYERNSHFNKINLILKWAEEKPSFNTDYVLSLKQACNRNGKLTDNQLSALNNIITKFKIKEY